MSAPPPRISVVIASVVGGRFLEACVASVVGQQHAPPFEIILVSCAPAADIQRLRQRHPELRVHEVGARTPVPKLRQLGVLRAGSDLVAVIEEHCRADRGWLAAAAAGLRPGDAAAGGPVWDDDYRRASDWTTYFVEYNAYLPPWREGPVDDLCGANIVYRRELLLQNVERLESGYWEATLHPKLLADGHTLRSVPSMIVRHCGPFDYGYYLRQRYLFSRAFAGARRPALSPPRRLAYLIAAPGVPAILLARLVSRVARRRHRLGRLASALPLLVPALTVYAAGEWMGYAFGPGRALEEVE